MKSLRLRLFVILLVTTGVVWFSAVGWIFFSTRAQVEKVLDARLREAARMVDSLITDQRIDVASAVRMVVREPGEFAPQGDYSRQLSCQIWSLSGDLVGRSDGAPSQALSTHDSGFQNTSIDGEPWRVYAVVDHKLGVRVLVGDSLRVRRTLVDSVVKGLLLPAALILPILAGLTWISVGGGLAPLRRLAEGLSERSADDLHPIATTDNPTELLPVKHALNGLLARLNLSRERERNFTAFAAHELKTPLAGLKTQAQVALATSDGEARTHALQRIIQAVNRTARLVYQLLELTEVENAQADLRPSGPDDLSCIMREVRANLMHLAAGRDCTILVDAPEAGEISIPGKGALLAAALRNVVENAIYYGPRNATVRCGIERAKDEVRIRVTDEGRGMSEAEIARATERFYRAPGAAGSGSGLGLSIAEAAMARLGGRISFIRCGGEFSVMLSIPRRLIGSTVG